MFFSGFVAVGVELCCEHTALLNCKALTPWAGVPGQELGLSTVFQRCRSREEGVGCWDVMFHMALWWHKMGLFAAWFSLMHVKSPSLTLAVPGMDYLGSVAELLNLAMSLPIMWVRRHQLLSCLLWNICSNWEFTQQLQQKSQVPAVLHWPGHWEIPHTEAPDKPSCISSILWLIKYIKGVYTWRWAWLENLRNCAGSLIPLCWFPRGEACTVPRTSQDNKAFFCFHFQLH